MLHFLRSAMTSSEHSEKNQRQGLQFSCDDTVETSNPLLPDGKDEEIQNEVHTVRKLNHLRIYKTSSIFAAAFLAFISTVAVIASLWLVWNAFQNSFELFQHKPFIYDLAFTKNQVGVVSCGDSIPEAMARGCTFDELADLWLPPKCSRAYVEQYAISYNGGSFPYYADQDGKHQIFNRSLYVGDMIYWSTTRDHLVHCQFNMFRFTHSLRSGSIVGHDGTFSGHVEHCATLLTQYALQAPGIDNIDVETQSGFGYC